MSDFMKKPCPHCPYRNDVKPYLTPERGEELAVLVHNPYNYFPCHKTTEHDDEGNHAYTAKEKICAGFLTVQSAVNGETLYDEDGFEPSFEICYADDFDMEEAYQQ